MKTRLSANQLIFALSAFFAVNGAFARISLVDNSVSGQLSGAKTTSETFNRRRLPKRPGGSSHSTSHSGYLGCLGLSDSELKSSWKLSGKPPKCQYKHHVGKGNSTSTGSSSNGNAGSSSSGSDNETTTDSDQVINNGNFENVNGDGGSEENTDNANSNGNGGNSNNNGNGGNANNSGNGGNANNNDNGGNANNNANEGNANNNDQDGKNSGNNNGQNQGQSSFDPYGDFDITKCDTYENLWLWDLSLTCAKEGDTSTCECVFAEEMMELGSLTCEDALACPRNCQICSRCMKLLGCQVPRSSTSFLGSSRNVTFLVFALGFLVCGGAYYTRRRRRRGPSILQKQLLDDNYSISDGSSDGTRVWLAPVASAHDQEGSSVYSYNNAAQLPIWIPPRRHGKDQKPVWLAPDASSRQLASTMNVERNDETPIWLAPDASSVQLKGPVDDCEDTCPDNKQFDQTANIEAKKEATFPESLTNQFEKEWANDQESESVSEAADTVLSEILDHSQIENKGSKEVEEEIALGAWSVEAEDPSINGIPCPQSNLSTTMSQTPDVKYKNEANPMIAPETVSEASDDDSLPTLT